MFGTEKIIDELAELRIELTQRLDRLSEQLDTLIRLEQERAAREQKEETK